MAGRVPTPILPVDSTLTVAHLMDKVNCECNVPLIRSLMTEEDSKLVLEVPISKRLPGDNRYWWPSNDGLFTVKSAYKMGMQGRYQLTGNDHESTDPFPWQNLWRLNLPPKLIHFIWRGCTGCVAVNQTLFKRHIAQEPWCPFCGSNEESMNHAIFECERTKAIWEASGYGDMLQGMPMGSFGQSVAWVLNKFQEEKKVGFLTTSWAIWGARNARIFEEKPSSPSQILLGLAGMVLDYQRYADKVYAKAQQQRNWVMYWTPPEADMMKINTNTALLTDGQVGLRAVMRDNTGKVLHVWSKRVLAWWKPDMAEAMAARYGLEMAHNIGVDHVQLEVDASKLADAINKGDVGLRSWHSIVNDIRVSLSRFNMSRCSHVKRGGNALAHFFARLCGEVGDVLHYDSVFPQVILELADFDK